MKDSLYGPRRDKETTPEELEEMLEVTRVLERINKLSQVQVEEVIRREGTPLEQYVRALEDDDKQLRKELQFKRKKTELQRKTGRKKQHWKTAQKKEREYHVRVRGPRRRAKMAREIAEGGWWPRVRTNWVGNGLDIHMSEDEWVEYIQPRVGDRLPTVWRIDTSKGISLGNIVVKDRETGELLYDGAEYQLYQQGNGPDPRSG